LEQPGKVRKLLKTSYPNENLPFNQSYPPFVEESFESDNPRFRCVHRRGKAPLFIPTVPLKFRVPDDFHTPKNAGITVPPTSASTPGTSVLSAQLDIGQGDLQSKTKIPSTNDLKCSGKS
jgi:hypothetical protein